MEIQDVLAKKLVAQLRFDPAPRFGDIRGQLVERLADMIAADQWHYGADISVFREDRSLTAVVTPGDFRLIAEHLDDRTAFVANLDATASWVLEELRVEALRFVGVRSHWIAAVSSFEELRDRMSERLSNPLQSIVQQLSVPLTDVGWSYEFHSADPKFAIRFGPMTREQGIAAFFDDQEADRLPLEFLFVDFDRVENEAVIPSGNAAEAWRRGLAENLRLGEEFTGALVAALL